MVPLLLHFPNRNNSHLTLWLLTGHSPLFTNIKGPQTPPQHEIFWIAVSQDLTAACSPLLQTQLCV